jgi:hypothetical protein
MGMQRHLLTAAALLALVLPASAAAVPGMFVGAAEDAPRTTDLVAAKAQMELARLAGLNAIRVTAIWAPTRTEAQGDDLVALQNAATAARLSGIRLIVSVMHYGSATTPRTPQARTEFAAFSASLVRQLPGVTDFIVGNEPNLNRYWLPQYGAGGTDLAAADYERLLAQTYDALKAASPDVTVIGGSVSPRGSDDPRSGRPTHSPTTFIPDIGKAYRASGRTKPIMDAFAFHPYGENSRVKPEFKHPKSTSIGLADYPKLVGLLTKAFTGTAQSGAKLPIVYDEYGVQSIIPPAKQSVYTNLDIASGRDAVDEATQGAYYKRAINMATCQATVAGMLIFHTVDESDLDRWQSGMYYADGTPKSSLPTIKQAAVAAEQGKTACTPLRRR